MSLRNPSASSSFSPKYLVLNSFHASSADTYFTSDTSSLPLSACPILSICAWVMPSSKNTVIATPSSALLIIYWKLNNIEKNSPNKKMQADIVAIDASENIMFLPIFLNPCLITYPIVLILIYISTSLFITDDDPVLHGDHPFIHLVNDLLVMCYHKNRSPSLVSLFQKAHDLP